MNETTVAHPVEWVPGKNSWASYTYRAEAPRARSILVAPIKEGEPQPPRLLRLSFPGLVYVFTGNLFVYPWEGWEWQGMNTRVRNLHMPNSAEPVCFSSATLAAIHMGHIDAVEAYWNTSFGNDDDSYDYDALIDAADASVVDPEYCRQYLMIGSPTYLRDTLERVG